MKDIHFPYTERISRYCFRLIPSIAFLLGLQAVPCPPTVGQVTAHVDAESWIACVYDNYSGIKMLMPREAKRLSLSDVESSVSWNGASHIGYNMRLTLDGYKALDAIYMGGYAVSGGLDDSYNLFCNGHLLAFPAKGNCETPESLLTFIRDGFASEGKEEYCQEIRDISFSDVQGKYFKETYGGNTGYSAWKIKEYVFLAVLTDRRNFGTSPRLAHIGPSESATKPVGKSMLPERHDTNSERQAEDTNGGACCAQFLIYGVIGCGIFSLFTRKK
ncbi:MAG: hypothetical protein ABFE13_25860 [Phycisphaerales bacterium]